MAERPQHTSRKMKSIHASGSKIEYTLGSALWKKGIRYRKQYSIIGTPDFAVVSQKVAVFCDSNFWHGHNWGDKFKSTLKRHRGFWVAKIKANRRRDRRVNRKLIALGWTVLRFWEHEINYETEKCVKRVLAAIRDSKR